eukprot:2813392-Pleurochrysis_carterae.AAC.2
MFEAGTTISSKPSQHDDGKRKFYVGSKLTSNAIENQKDWNGQQKTSVQWIESWVGDKPANHFEDRPGAIVPPAGPLPDCLPFAS